MTSTTTRHDSGAPVLRERVDEKPRAASQGATLGARSAHPTTESRMNRIARRAHEIYEARGGEHGKDMEDWLNAERQIDAEIEREQETPPIPRP
jgi:hypothetical protein